MKKIKLINFLEEIILYSGQYANFYILMNISKSKLGYFIQMDHIILIGALLLQAAVLSAYGSKISVRFWGSFIAPVIYTLFEYNNLYSFVTNMGHFFFWATTLIVATLGAIKLHKSNKKIQRYIDVSIVVMNIFIFLIIYIYMDIVLKFEESANTMTSLVEYNDRISIFNLKANLIQFFGDSAHVYLVLGGIILGVAIGLDRLKIHDLKEKIRVLFGTYVDESISERLIESDGNVSEKAEVAVLYCDIRSFTSYSEAKNPKEVVDSLNTYFEQWEVFVRKYNGIIDKFIGDAILVLFLENTHKEKASNNAVSCALDFLSAFTEFNETKLNDGFEGVGISIHWGDVILGNIGGKTRKDFTVIGDTVNTASRLEHLNKEMNSKLVISEVVWQNLSQVERELFGVSSEMELRGKNEVVKVYSYR